MIGGMKYAAAVGSAGYHHFTDLNVSALRWVFGADLPIVITDDNSTDSYLVEEVAAKKQCYYKRADVPLGHFAGDVQTFIDALALGEAVGADIVVKLSQRCIVAHPDLRPIIEGKFIRNPQVSVVMPGRPNPNFIRVGHQQFARFPILTDIVFLRVGHVKPEMIKDEYEKQVREGKAYHDCFVEVFFDKMKNGVLKDRVETAPEITDPRGGQPPYILRRYQATQDMYSRLAERFGIRRTGNWELGERHTMQRGYNPRPAI